MGFGCMGAFVTVHQFWAVFVQIVLGTGCPGDPPPRPLRAVIATQTAQFWGPVLGQSWALPGRPRAAREAQSRMFTVTKVPIGPRWGLGEICGKFLLFLFV